MRRLEEVEQAHIVLSLELLAQPAVMVRNISVGRNVIFAWDDLTNLIVVLAWIIRSLRWPCFGSSWGGEQDFELVLISVPHHIICFLHWPFYGSSWG